VIPIEIPPETGLFDDADDRGPVGVLVGVPDSAVSDPLARGTEAPPMEPIRVGGKVTAPRKRHHVSPIYPAIAAAARVQGTVSLEATIDEDGNVVNLRVLVSIPLLDGAALDAVRQWKYEPTLLNGSPVPILMTVSVKFELGR
jgi:protein TonB